MRFFPATEGFRSSHTYNNIMFTAAGHVVEILSGQPWEDALLETLFEPLGMTDSRFTDRLTDEDFDNMATPYYNEDGEPRPVSKEIFGYLILT